jgi:hypothetical protein
MLEYILIAYFVAVVLFFVSVIKDIKSGINVRTVIFLLLLSLIWPVVLLMYYLLDGINS